MCGQTGQTRHMCVYVDESKPYKREHCEGAVEDGENLSGAFLMRHDIYAPCVYIYVFL